MMIEGNTEVYTLNKTREGEGFSAKLINQHLLKDEKKLQKLFEAKRSTVELCYRSWKG